MRKTVLITGTNRGIGLALSEYLLNNYSENYHYILTTRKQQTDHQIIKKKEIFLKNSSFEIQQLDIYNMNSIEQFFQKFEQKQQKIDVLFNNAGVYDKSRDKGETNPPNDLADWTLRTNFINTVIFTEKMIPYLEKNAKIIMNSSMLGQLKNQPLKGQELLMNEDLINTKNLIDLANQYIETSNQNQKFSNLCYHTSKAFLNSYVRYFHKQLLLQNQSIFAVHPGRVRTDMGGPDAHYNTDEAVPYLANIIVQFPFERHQLSGKLQFFNNEINF